MSTHTLTTARQRGKITSIRCAHAVRHTHKKISERSTYDGNSDSHD